MWPFEIYAPLAKSIYYYISHSLPVSISIFVLSLAPGIHMMNRVDDMWLWVWDLINLIGMLKLELFAWVASLWNKEFLGSAAVAIRHRIYTYQHLKPRSKTGLSASTSKWFSMCCYRHRFRSVQFMYFVVKWNPFHIRAFHKFPHCRINWRTIEPWQNNLQASY